MYLRTAATAMTKGRTVIHLVGRMLVVGDSEIYACFFLIGARSTIRAGITRQRR